MEAGSGPPAAHQPSQGQEPLCCGADLPRDAEGTPPRGVRASLRGPYHLCCFSSSWFTLPGRKNCFLVENLLFPHQEHCPPAARETPPGSARGWQCSLEEAVGSQSGTAWCLFGFLVLAWTRHSHGSELPQPCCP